jgi:hypothetical protein
VLAVRATEATRVEQMAVAHLWGQSLLWLAVVVVEEVFVFHL